MRVTWGVEIESGVLVSTNLVKSFLTCLVNEFKVYLCLLHKKAIFWVICTFMFHLLQLSIVFIYLKQRQEVKNKLKSFTHFVFMPDQRHQLVNWYGNAYWGKYYSRCERAFNCHSKITSRFNSSNSLNPNRHQGIVNGGVSASNFIL